MKECENQPGVISPESRKRLVFRERDAMASPVYVDFNSAAEDPHFNFADRVSTKFSIYEDIS